MSACRGCGAELPPNKAPGRERVWCSNRCRKTTLYGGTCIECGAPTAGSSGGLSKTPERCVPCANARNIEARRLWDRDSVLDAIRRWADQHGQPPAAMDWNPRLAIANGRDDIAARYESTGPWPTVWTVQTYHGSWNAAIRAAGFTPRGRGKRGKARPRLDVAA